MKVNRKFIIKHISVGVLASFSLFISMTVGCNKQMTPKTLNLSTSSSSSEANPKPSSSGAESEDTLDPTEVVPDEVSGGDTPTDPPDTLADPSYPISFSTPDGFRSITLSAQFKNQPDRTKTHQRVKFYLHPTGGEKYEQGDTYTALTMSPEEATSSGVAATAHKADLPFEFHVLNPAGINPAYIMVRPVDPIMTDAGVTMKTDWFGYAHGPDKSQAHPYTEAKLDALYKWFFETYPLADKKHVILGGRSLGGWGSFAYGLRRPHMYAAIFALLPKWKRSDIWLLDTRKKTTVIPKTFPTGVKMPDGEDYLSRMNMVEYVKNPMNKIPFLAWSIGRKDPYGIWATQVEAVKALQATKRGFVFAWNDGDHVQGILPMKEITASYDEGDFALGQGYPIFMNSSLDQNPEIDPEGGINLGFKFQNVVESETEFSVEVSNILGVVTVDILPNSSIFTHIVAPRHITIPASTWVKVSFYR